MTALAQLSVGIVLFWTGEAAIAESAFTDIENHWAKNCIEKLGETQILTGYPDNTFRPDEPVTRAEYATLLKRAFPDAETVREASNFRDVSESYWAREAIATSNKTGFLSGYPGNLFQPTETIQRVQVLIALTNGLRYSPTDSIATIINSAIADAHEIPDYARSSVAAATQRRLVVNYPDVELLKPTAVASRGEVAAFLCQALVEPGQVSGVPQQYVTQTGKIEVESMTLAFENVAVELYYQKFSEESLVQYGNLRVRINRDGKLVLDRLVPRDTESDRLFFSGPESAVRIVDLDGDREPEILLELYTGGAHCCNYTVIYGYRPESEKYTAIKHWWYNSYYNLEDLNNDRNLEFKSADDRFAYAFAPYAASFRPLQIWQYIQGQMVDVTRDFPKQIYRDSSRLFQAFNKDKDTCNTNSWGGCHEGVLAAYLATKYLLNQEENGWDFVQQVYRGNGCLAIDNYCPGRGSYFRELRIFLRDTGYVQR